MPPEGSAAGMRFLTHEELVEAVGVPLPTTAEETWKAVRLGVEQFLKTETNASGYKDIYYVERCRKHPW